MLTFLDKIFLTGFSFWTILIALSLIPLSLIFLIAGICTHEELYSGPFSNNETSYHLLLVFWILLNIAWGLFMLVCLVEFITSFVYVARETCSGIEFMLRFIGWLIVMVGLGDLVERVYGDGTHAVGRNTPYQKFQKYTEPPLNR